MVSVNAVWLESKVDREVWRVVVVVGERTGEVGEGGEGLLYASGSLFEHEVTTAEMRKMGWSLNRHGTTFIFKTSRTQKMV